MALLELFGTLAPIVQLALVLGCFATVFLVACRRDAATNLAVFLREVFRINQGVQKNLEPLEERTGRRRRSTVRSVSRRRSRPN